MKIKDMLVEMCKQEKDQEVKKFYERVILKLN